MIKKIGIKDLRSLIRRRIENPQRFKNNTLIIWNGGDVQTSVLYHIIKDECIAYNKTQPQENMAGYQYADLGFRTDDYTSSDYYMLNHATCEGYMSHKGILLDTGCFFTDEKEYFIDFINTRVNLEGHVSENWALVACAHYEISSPEMFGSSCEMYELAPEVEEWGEYLLERYNEAVCKPIIAYVKEKGFQMELFRWNNVIEHLESELEDNELTDLTQLPRKDFRKAIRGLGGFNCQEFKEVMDNFFGWLHQDKEEQTC